MIIFFIVYKPNQMCTNIYNVPNKVIFGVKFIRPNLGIILDRHIYMYCFGNMKISSHFRIKKHTSGREVYTFNINCILPDLRILRGYFSFTS